MSSINFVFNVYIANKLGAEGSGIFELIMSIYSFIITFANSGISLAATRIVSEEIDGNHSAGLKNAMSKCIIYSLTFGILASIILISIAEFCAKTLLHDKITPYPLYIMAISMPFSSVITSLNGYFTGVRRVSKTSISHISTMMLQVFLTYTLLSIFPSNNLDTICTYIILASSIATVFEFIFTYILYLIDRRKTISNTRSSDNPLKKILQISIPVAITSYIRSGLSTIQQLLVPFSLEMHSESCEKALTEYGLINGMTMPILMFPCIIITSCASLLIPEFARYKLKKDYSRMQEVISIIFKFTSIFSFCIIGVFLTFTEEISFFIYHNLDITTFLVVLSPLIILMYLDKIIDSMLRGLDKQVGVMFCNIFDLVSTIILIYTLVPKLGISGYLLVIIFSEIFNFTISLIQLCKATGFKFDIFSYIITPFIIVIMTKYIFERIDKFIEYSIGFVIFKVFIFIGIYLLLLFLSNKLCKTAQKKTISEN